jgi:hypothetical protein
MGRSNRGQFQDTRWIRLEKNEWHIAYSGSYRLSGQSFAPFIKGKRVQEGYLEHLGTQLYRNGAHHCSETSVTKYKSPNSKDLSHRGGSLKSRKVKPTSVIVAKINTATAAAVLVRLRSAACWRPFATSVQRSVLVIVGEGKQLTNPSKLIAILPHSHPPISTRVRQSDQRDWEQILSFACRSF